MRRVIVTAGFGLMAVWLWTRYPLGEGAADLLPALAAFPLYVWLSRNWSWRDDGAVRWNWRGLVTGGLVLFAGLAIDHTLVLALGWVVLWRAWLSGELTPGARATQAGPLALLLCGFPWLGLEGQALGWWFRHSGAWAAGETFEVLGLAVSRDGTFLNVQGLPLAVDAACSGLHALQAMLVAGTALALITLRGTRFWVGIALLPLLAWLANLLRIVTLGVTGLSFGPEAAMGWFHEWGGWAVLMGMFALCSLVFSLMAPAPRRAKEGKG
ncbi:MAG: archaeosortase/exosortase family protein [Opitutaceae bacterium]